MTETNRVICTSVRETTFGTTPTTPRMRTVRFAGEGLKFMPKYIQPTEIRSDRMNSDPIKVNEENSGPINGEFSYPEADSPMSDFIRSLMWNDWVNSTTFFNDGTADSVITDAGTTANTYAVVSGGAAVKVGHLVRATGFTNSANNQIFRVASSTATTIVGTSLSLTAETAPPATAQLKVVGFAGASGDITATATGLGSTALDFTTLGLSVGMWVKVGGTAAGDKFGTAALNDWMRIQGPITATALPLDNRPTGWTTDAGTSKTIKVWFGDYIKNGTTRISLSIERGFLGQAVPTYILQRGMIASQGEFSAQTEQEITWNFTFMGLTGTQSTTTQDAVPDAATTNRIMSANVNIGRIGEGGVALATPNFVRANKITVNNNLRMITAKGNVGAVAINSGSFDVSIECEAYFGDNTLLAKLINSTVSSYNERAAIDSQAVVWDVPRVTFTDGSPSASGKNSDVTLSLKGDASVESTYSAHLIINRIPYFEV